jgi:hypothetical protein
MFSCRLEAALDDLGRWTSASTRNLGDALVERDQSGTQFCPKIIRGHGVKLFDHICLVCTWIIFALCARDHICLVCTLPCVHVDGVIMERDSESQNPESRQ